MSLCPDTETQLKKKTAANWEYVHLLQGGDEKSVETSRDLLLGRDNIRPVQEIQNTANNSTTGLYVCVSETFKFQPQIPKLEYLNSFT